MDGRDSTETNLAARRMFAGNIRRFYVFEFMASFMLFIPIWVLYLVDERGISLGQVAILEALFQMVIVAVGDANGGRRRPLGT